MITSVALTGSNQTILTGAGIYCGFAIDETAGATAKLRIYDNTAASGTLLDVVNLGSSESARELYPGIRALNGIFVQVVFGTFEGSVRILKGD